MFIEYDIHKKIQEECEKDPEFKEMYEKVKAENDLVWELIQARKRENITQEELAIKTGIKQQSISRLEKFSSKPNLNTIERIAHALGYRISLEKIEKNALPICVSENEPGDNYESTTK